MAVAEPSVDRLALGLDSSPLAALAEMDTAVAREAAQMALMTGEMVGSQAALVPRVAAWEVVVPQDSPYIKYNHESYRVLYPICQ